MKNNLLYILSLFFIFGCKPNLDGDVSFSPGTANFSKTIYVGDNLLSGYTNGGLYAEGQSTSIAQILSAQFQMVGGDAVGQPTMSGTTGSGRLVMTSYSGGSFEFEMKAADAQTGTTMVFSACQSDSSLPLYSSYSGSITNYAMPGLQVGEILTANMGVVNSSNYNPFLSRVTSNFGSYYDIINNENPTFFVVAFGLSDMLGYAENGASCGGTTSKDVFEMSLDTLVSQLVDKAGKGVLCEIPRLTKLPFLNANYSSEQDIYIRAKLHINDNAYETRKFEAGDQFLRANLDKIGVDGYGLSDSFPIANEDVVDYKEIEDIAGDIFNYNVIIKDIGAKYNLPVVSMENYLLAAKGTFQGDSIILNGTNTQVNFEPNSAVSLDGVFPSPRGSAAIANQFIIAINEFYEASVPLADINKYEGLKIP